MGAVGRAPAPVSYCLKGSGPDLGKTPLTPTPGKEIFELFFFFFCIREEKEVTRGGKSWGLIK